MKNLAIKSKLWILTIITTIGFIIIGITVSNQVNNLTSEYEKSKSINKGLGALKSILIGGLMINSASNVYVLNNKNHKPLNTVKSGIKKFNEFENVLKKVSPKCYSKIKAELNTFILMANNTVNKALNTKQLQVKDTKKLLKPWRALKDKIQNINTSLKKTGKISQVKFYDTLSHLVTQVLLIIIFIFIIYLILSLIITKTITSGIKSLHNGVNNLLTTKDTSSRVDLDTKEELGAIARDFNKYLQSIEDGINEDNELIKNASKTMARVQKGWYSETISGHTSNQSLEVFKNTVNDMINATKQHFSNVNIILEEYAHLDYRNELKLENVEKDGVFDLLINDINKLRNSITEMLIDNKQTGLTLDSSSDTLLQNVDILNKNSNEAAAALEETAAALEEVTSNIASNTNNVIKMAEFATKVTKSTSEGENLATQTTQAMDEINQEVTSITDAITIIDQIAFQTNILSLNAAVEAATAGEAGKGFAVVAQEVRNLASRSAEAANEIKALVQNASDKANKGKDIADKMIDGYLGLNKNISKTIELISDVEMASKEQKLGIEQINDAITALDQQTQQNASTASQTQSIAMNTDTLAKLIVTNADEKEFTGKDSVKAKEISTEKQVDIVNVKSSNKSEIKNTIKATPAKQIIANNEDEDEWASF